MRRVTLLVLATVLPATTGAQETSPVAVGLGVALDAAATPVQTAFGIAPQGRMGNILVPVRVSRRIRVQPSVGFLRQKQERTTGLARLEERVTVWSVGVALHYLFPIHESAQVYLGPSLGLNRFSQMESFDNVGLTQRLTAKRTDTVLGGVAGGEYYLASRFSIGGEVQLYYLMAGDTEMTLEQTPPPPSPPLPVPVSADDGSLIHTNAQLVVRWFFSGR